MIANTLEVDRARVVDKPVTVPHELIRSPWVSETPIIKLIFGPER